LAQQQVRERGVEGGGVSDEYFAQTVNRLKGKVTMIFITRQVPMVLQVNGVVKIGQHAMQMSLVKEET
jgi:subfamily B ATP-binding cassette protein HlyB/CyaB